MLSHVTFQPKGRSDKPRGGCSPRGLEGPATPPSRHPQATGLVQGWSRAGPGLVLVGPDLVLKMRRKVRWDLRLVPAWSWWGSVGPDLVLKVTMTSGWATGLAQGWSRAGLGWAWLGLIWS